MDISKVTTFVVYDSLILVMGLPVLSLVHDFEDGIVASENSLLLIDPGNGHPAELMVP